VHFVPFTNELISHINAADVVVTMCGYNTVSEVLSLGKRAIVIVQLLRLALALRYSGQSDPAQ
jgi:predicted glycosyltransferase